MHTKRYTKAKVENEDRRKGKKERNKNNQSEH